MSAPDFDPEIERAYRVTPEFADSALFDAEVEVRLERRWRIRRAVIGVLGLGVMFWAIGQLVTVRFQGLLQSDSVNNLLLPSQRSEAFRQVGDIANQIGLGDVSVGILSGPYLVIMMGAVAAVVLTSMAVRLSNSL